MKYVIRVLKSQPPEFWDHEASSQIKVTLHLSQCLTSYRQISHHFIWSLIQKNTVESKKDVFIGFGDVHLKLCVCEENGTVTSEAKMASENRRR